MHDQTRKTVTLLLFLLLVPVLTCVIIGGAVLRKVPENTRSIERILSLQTGLDWNIESSEYRSPYCIRLKNVSLKYIANTAPVYSAPVIDITFFQQEPDSKYFTGIVKDEADTSKETLFNTAFNAALKMLPFEKYFGKRPAGYYRISVPKSEMHLDTADAVNSSAAIQGILSRLAERFAELSEIPVQLLCDEINCIEVSTVPFAESGTLNSRGTEKYPLQFRFVSANIYRTEAAYRSEWLFQIPAVSETERQQIIIELQRNHQKFSLTFKTQYQPVPSRWAALFCPFFANLGDTCLFSGEISVNRSGSGQQAVQLHNAFFNNLNTARLTADYAPSALPGIMDVSIEDAVLAAGVLQAKGWLNAKDGTIERGLFHRLVDRFALRVHPPEILDSAAASIPYDFCNINFQLTSEGIVFWSSQTQNVFMTRKGDGFNTQPMFVFFTQNNKHPVSYHSLLSLFAPDAAPIVPLTPGIQRLVSFLPSDAFMQNKDIQNKNGGFAIPVLEAVPAAPQPLVANPHTSNFWSTEKPVPVFRPD